LVLYFGKDFSVDQFTKEKRSEIMRSVRNRDTAPEIRLRRALWKAGLRYRTRTRIEGAQPDITFLGKRVAVFVDGCFWHGCPRHYTNPVENAAFWRAKIEKNRTRDARNNEALENRGWTVLRFWECEVEKELDRVVARIQSCLHGTR
jgi:DNA mismatch endonuclease, patch repair protein